MGGVLQVRGLSKSFGDRCPPGCILACGRKGKSWPSSALTGSGKTTLLNVITGVYRPDAGGVWLNGEQLVGLTPAQICIKRRCPHLPEHQAV